MNNQQKSIQTKPEFNQIRLLLKESGTTVTRIATLELCGVMAPERETINGKTGLKFMGGEHGSSYAVLNKSDTITFDDCSGFTLSTWVYFDKSQSIWERLFDFGVSEVGPYVFLTRKTRGVCFNEQDIAIDYYGAIPEREWVHIAMSIAGTDEGRSTYAGPKLYVNGVCVVNGAVSQTSSGRYKGIREFFRAMNAEPEVQCYLGHSQFLGDPDFSGVLSQMVVADFVMSEEEIVQDMCSGMSDKALIDMAYEKYLVAPKSIIDADISLQKQLITGEVDVVWESSREDLITNQGKVVEVNEPHSVQLRAILTRNNEIRTKTFDLTIKSKDDLTHRLVVHGNREGTQISQDLYGLFYEDINNAADGGIYAELIQNRSFESFTYETYDVRSGVHGKSSGRILEPLAYWFGDLDLVKPCYEDTIGEFLGCTDTRANATFIKMLKGAHIENRGFCDQRNLHSIPVIQGESYLLSVWIKGEGQLLAFLADEEGELVSNNVTICGQGADWKKYGASSEYIFIVQKTGKVGLCLEALTDCELDMVSLMPTNVWGTLEDDGQLAAANYKRNSNYRLRRDLVQSLRAMNPKFLRFPGGCISEGSYIWENVYDWKESIGPVEMRIENFNVWGYMMTMGLGYYEYFQLAEDLKATPLPVMACGVLCQARSDYAHPAGGKLRDKYITNFIDLIDFALSSDFANNSFARLRKELGHVEPFDLRYLGVGNENWGHEFYANFEVFKKAIDDHVASNYPGHGLTIISTVGAQGDDNAYQNGWKFLGGYETFNPTMVFSDGEKEIIEQVNYYGTDADYMMTIADEHFYRSNEYLLNNADRYNYYALGSKVFVGEYASTDKNTMAGALAEAAMMTHFEERSDCVKLAATAPLFNKVRGDGQYRWTPDCIWFDDDAVWHTPNYYVQSLFAQHIGHTTIPTSLEELERGKMEPIQTCGGFEIPILEGTMLIHTIEVKDCLTQVVLFEETFKATMDPGLEIYGEGIEIQFVDQGILLTNTRNVPGGLRYAANWKNYVCRVRLTKLSGEDGLGLGVGYKKAYDGTMSTLRFVVDYYDGTSGLKVIKRDIEGYKLGDFASSEVAGNMRGVYKHNLIKGVEYTLELVHDTQHTTLACHILHTELCLDFEYRLLPYSHQMFTTVSQNDTFVYIKLVNPYPAKLRIAIELQELPVHRDVEIHSLSGDETTVHIENVNTKNEEQIRPISRTTEVASLKNWEIPEYSVHIIKLKKEQ